MTSAKSLLPASDTTRILAPSTHGIRVISMKLPSVIFGRLICHDYRGWIIPSPEPSPSIGHQFITSRDVNAIVHRESATAITMISSMEYIIYTSLYVVDRPLLAVENRTMVLSQRQNSTSYAQKNLMPYTTTSPIPPTNLPDRSKAMRQKRIYNIEWVLRWRFSAYHCEPNVQHARCTYHK